MGSIDKYCPHCASEKVFVVEVEFEPDFGEELELSFEGSEEIYYECGDCHSTWEPHYMQLSTNFYGTS